MNARNRNWALLSLSVLSLSFAACGGGEDLPAGAQSTQEPVSDAEKARAARQAQLDRLRSLGYAEVSDESYDESESGVVHGIPQLMQPGYNLYTNRYACSAVLMDNRGKELRRWERPDDRSWSNLQVLPDGDLLIIGQESSDENTGAIDEHRYLLRLAFDGEERWQTKVNAHHDCEVTPDGQVAVLSFRRRPHPNGEEGLQLREDTVELLDLDGKRLEERSLYEILQSNPELLEIQDVAPSEKDGLRYVDLIHANSVEFLVQPEGVPKNELFAPGNVLVSTRHQDAVIIFNWETSELVWAWGRGEILGPHDATLLDNGHFLIFDNGLGRGWSRVIELDPTTKEIVWEYRAKPQESFYTASRGSNQRLANGNTLVAESDSARAFEVTPQGKLVWAWINPERNANNKLVTIVRMKRLPKAFIDPFLSRE